MRYFLIGLLAMTFIPLAPASRAFNQSSIPSQTPTTKGSTGTPARACAPVPYRKCRAAHAGRAKWVKEFTATCMQKGGTMGHPTRTCEQIGID